MAFVVVLALHVFEPSQEKKSRSHVPIRSVIGAWSIAGHTFGGGSKEAELKDTIMWVTGIVLAMLAAGMMVWTDIGDGPLLVLGMLGIFFIAVGARDRRSQHR